MLVFNKKTTLVAFVDRQGGRACGGERMESRGFMGGLWPRASGKTPGSAALHGRGTERA
jgi:hypothetical protein